MAGAGGGKERLEKERGDLESKEGGAESTEAERAESKSGEREGKEAQRAKRQRLNPAESEHREGRGRQERHRLGTESKEARTGE